MSRKHCILKVYQNRHTFTPSFCPNWDNSLMQTKQSAHDVPRGIFHT